MDQIPNDSLVGTNVFDDGQHLPFESLFPAGHDQAFNDASWGLHASATYHAPETRAAATRDPSAWPQPTSSHISASNTPNNFNGPSNVYGRSPLHSPAAFAQTNNNFAAFGNPNYNNFGQQQAYQQQLQQQNINPAFQQYANPSTGSSTIAPHSLTPVAQSQAPTPTERPQTGFNYPTLPQQQSANSAAQIQPAADQHALMQVVPAGQPNGRFSVIDFSALVRATNSERLAMHANIGKQGQEFPVNKSTALPAYVKRNSRNDLKRTVKNDPKLQARLSSKASLVDRGVGSSTRPANAASPAQSTASNEGIKYESDSESESESDVSLYSDEEDDLAGAPLPSKRPEESAKGAVEYDTIKALWRNKRKTIDAASIRKGLGDFWDVVKTVRDRWKTDTKAVEEAEAKKRVNDIALLKSRVKDQRDMLEVAFRAVLKHGYRSIIELFSENSSFLYLCYQFLLDRFKAKDLNGSVPRLILEILSLTTSITNDKLDKTYLGKVLPRYAREGDGKTKFYAKKIIEAAASNSKGTQSKVEPEPAAGVKRSSAAAGNTTAAAPAKKAAVTTPNTGANGTASKAAVKKPADSSKPATTTASAAAAKTKTVQAKPSGFFAGLQSANRKPTTSNSDKATAKPAVQKAAAPVKPAFNLAETLANLAKPKEEPKKPEPKPDASRDSEPPERKAKRVARLARGATGVRWREAQDLVEIRYFSHDPAEELDHDASQMRDVKDVGGEGRMLKQHADMMDVDEDDDSADDTSKFVTFSTPSEIDFSEVKEDERSRQYKPFGGGELEPDSAERAIREQYERDNLIVIYSDSSDIPPDPREPADPYNGEPSGPLKEFGAPPEKFAARANQRNAKRFTYTPPAMNGHQMPSAPALAPPIAPGIDFGAIKQALAAQQAPQQAPQQPAPQYDLTSLLQQFQQPTAQAPAQNPFPNYQQPPPFEFPQQQQQAPAPALPPGQPDITAILAAMGKVQGNAGQPQAPPPAFAFPPNFPMPYGAMPAPPQQQQQQQQQQPQQSDSPASKKKPENRWYKTKTCKYWQEGKCRKGDACSYLHE